MPSEPRARELARLSGAAALALVALAGCVDGPSRPTTPAYSGNQRANPTRPARPGEPIPSTPVSTQFADSRGAYMPRHIPNSDRRELRRIAVLLPFSSPDPDVRKYANGIFNAIQMSLFQVNAQDVVLMPRDSGADAQSAGRVADEVVRDGAIAIVGPLFGSQIPAVAQAASRVGAPVFSFSTDVTAQGQGAYLMSLTPKTEVARVVDWATQQGITRFTMFAPDEDYGHAVEAALRQEVAAHSGTLFVAVEYYRPGDNSPVAQAKSLSAAIKRENEASPGKVAVLIPERSVELRTVASVLSAVDPETTRQVRFLGTGTWNDPDVWREPALFGGVFPAPNQTGLDDFSRRYKAVFGEDAPRFSSFGYDAGALAATLAKNDRLDGAMLQRQEGFTGVNGLFRFSNDGSIQRALAVMQITRDGERVISPAVAGFSPGS